MTHGIPWKGKNRHRFNTQDIYQPPTVASPFNIGFHMLFSVPATGFVGLLLSCQNDKSTLSKQTFLTWTTIFTIREIILPASVWGNGIQVNREAWDNWNASFFFLSLSLSSQPCICKLPLCLLHFIYVLDVSPSVTAHARSQLRALFYFSPSALLPARSVPLNFLGTLSRPFQIGLGLSLPCFMSLCCRIPHLI